MNVFIIHGAYGNPEENWFPWLKSELENLGLEVIIPKFPTPENQTLENWTNTFQPFLSKLDENSIFVAHSIGPAFVLNILERIQVKISACFFVAGFTGPLNNAEFNKLNESFADRKFDWKKIINSCEIFFVYASDNDPYVSLEKGKQLASNLNTSLKIVEKAGHFNTAAGYKQFELLLRDIKYLIKKN